MKGMVFGLALIGVMLASIIGAYSMWSETLTVNGTVNTGEVKVAFTGWSCSDTGADPQLPNSTFHNEEGKDVANCDISVTQVDDDGNAIVLRVTINNAYPGYTPVIALNITNIGTIPVKLYNSSVKVDSPIIVELATPDSTQMHPDDTHTYYLTISVPQDAAENSSYSFEVTLTFAQWNEVSTP
ncbi:hypothetical protein PYJP_16470 [Pyrofollis japonicus]|uniref:hypothetical protein n=1 Tax=Pyrofollis japonicus TaxID=3060460 RepID=UPI00295A8E4B|nr:hypothetical protein [Pyrofollis japonicus]BEP18295.1 hypothetical protein PYJP_16470 [Pyrofollis japonicus]